MRVFKVTSALGATVMTSGAHAAATVGRVATLLLL